VTLEHSSAGAHFIYSKKVHCEFPTIGTLSRLRRTATAPLSAWPMATAPTALQSAEAHRNLPRKKRGGFDLALSIPSI
jgi:hypothetical protein